MHPVENIRGSLSNHLTGRRIVLAVCGSIAAVKTIELARELIRHGAEVIPVMSEAATRIIHPDALHFGCGRAPILHLTGAVEHVALLGDVPGKADALLVAPATANTVSKMALGIDDSVVTTCATVAFGTKTPVIIAPAMHEAMLDHPIVTEHQETLIKQLGVTWVEPDREEKKAKLADVEAIVEAVIHRLARPAKPKRALVITGATWEKVDAVRILTNRSSGHSGHIIATELARRGYDVTVWQGRPRHAYQAPVALQQFDTVADLLGLVKAAKPFDMVWMPAAIGDYDVVPVKGKIASEKSVSLTLKPLPKVIEAVRKRMPKATLIAFKAEASAKDLVMKARDRLKRYQAQAVIANAAATFESPTTRAVLVLPESEETFEGPKKTVLAAIVAKLTSPPKAVAKRKA